MRLINNNILHRSAAVTKANSGRSSPAITDWGTPASGGKFTLLPGRGVTTPRKLDLKIGKIVTYLVLKSVIKSGF